MSAPLAPVNDTDKKLATQLMLGGAIVMGVMGLLAFVLGGYVWGIIDFAIAGALGYLGYMRTVAGDLNVAKIATLICAAIILLLGLLALGSAGAGGGLGFLIALVVIATGCGLIYAAMLISPGRKLF